MDQGSHLEEPFHNLHGFLLGPDGKKDLLPPLHRRAHTPLGHLDHRGIIEARRANLDALEFTPQELL